MSLSLLDGTTVAKETDFSQVLSHRGTILITIFNF